MCFGNKGRNLLCEGFDLYLLKDEEHFVEKARTFLGQFV